MQVSISLDECVRLIQMLQRLDQRPVSVSTLDIDPELHQYHEPQKKTGGKSMWTYDPVRDQYRHESDQAEAERKRDWVPCTRCKCKIYREDETYEGDSYYEIDDMFLCEECAKDWLEEQRVRLT